MTTLELISLIASLASLILAVVAIWLSIIFYRMSSQIGEDIKDVEFSWPIGMPLCRALGKGLWEVRSDLPQGRIARVLFCVHGGRMVLLHGFIKKTQKTPVTELELALKRKKEIT
jgi:phage-related protein